LTSKSKTTDSVATLTILATTDVHGALTEIDEVYGTPREAGSLTAIASLVSEIRECEKNVFLFDNGDFLQGAPMCDFAALHGKENKQVHPVILAMNDIGYDAVGLGNHEFDYGLETLNIAISQADFPVVGTNITGARHRWLSHLLIERTITDQNGKKRPISIGVISVLPLQLRDWNHDQLDQKYAVLLPGMMANESAQELKENGADLVVALVHSGIDAGETDPYTEHFAQQIAALDKVDILVTGHSHRSFPDGTMDSENGIDGINGKLHSKPCVQPGSGAAYLGRIDLSLSWQNGRWSVVDSTVGLLTSAAAPADAALEAKLSPSYAQLSEHLDRVIGETAQPLQCFFAHLQPDPATQLVAASMRVYGQDAFANTELPVLAATSPNCSAGKHRHDHACFIQPGPIRARDLYQFYPFPNKISALRLTGAEIRTWLEIAASGYQQVKTGDTDRPLTNPKFFSYRFDAIYGLTYDIDLSVPPLADHQGRHRPQPRPRITNLCYNTHPIDDTQEFIVMAGQYRANGGGYFPRYASSKHLPVADRLVRDLVQNFLKSGESAEDVAPAPWSLIYPTGASVTTVASPEAASYLFQIEDFFAERVENTPTGQTRYRLQRAS
jgi:2',3'-cyclic-nucleotide 2'-phosphodiesterase/3'-nucleotidase